MIVEVCPKCGAELRCMTYTSYPPFHVRTCPKCGWKHEEKEAITYLPFNSTKEEVAMNEKEILTQAITTYGQQLQIIVAIEEMSELTKELCKAQRGAQNRDHIAEEIADVEIMLEQLQLIYNVAPSVESWRQSKIRRLAKRLEDANVK